MLKLLKSFNSSLKSIQANLQNWLVTTLSTELKNKNKVITQKKNKFVTKNVKQTLKKKKIYQQFLF